MAGGILEGLRRPHGPVQSTRAGEKVIDKVDNRRKEGTWLPST
jgi:hypothetical protein